MRIYIDEAGAFVVPSSAQSLFSLVLAVVVPSSAEDALFAEFSTLRDGWSNQGGEVKGSKLNESQAAQLVDLASRHDVLVKFFADQSAEHYLLLTNGQRSPFRNRLMRSPLLFYQNRHRLPNEGSSVRNLASR